MSLYLFRRRWMLWSIAWILVMAMVGQGHAQQRGQQGALSGAPGIGDSLPVVKVYLGDGTPFLTSQLKGSYSVLVFGCLT